MAKVIQEGFDLEKCVIWTTEWLNQFTLHQVQQHLMLIEVEKEFCESVFFHLKDAGYSNVFLQPNSELMDKYVNESESPIVVTNLISRAPIKKTASKIDFYIPTLEKILVDVFSEEAIFMAFKGTEQKVIFENAIRYYELNFKKLFAYAKRRNKETGLKKYLYKCFP